MWPMIVRMSAEAVVLHEVVAEIPPCGTRNTHSDTYAELQVVSDGKVLARSRTSAWRWKHLSVRTVAPRMGHVAIRLVAGYSSRVVNYRSYRGAACVPATVVVTAKGAITLPKGSIDPVGG